ncbi:MAG: glucosamine-6-phosphate deaminase [Deinococcota bacterium]
MQNSATYAGNTQVEILPTNQAMGEAAAVYAASFLRQILEARAEANIAIATGNSQLSFFAALRQQENIDWSRVRVFHLDEYVGITASHPASFRAFLTREFVTPLQPKHFYGIEADGEDINRVLAAYTALLEAHPLDLCCMGIGENGHLAFNDPPYADFADPEMIKQVKLDEASRQQQVGEGHFASLDDVPTHALTLTIPTLLSATCVLVMVPETRKAKAVQRALQGPITEDVPASILQQTPQARIFLDQEAASQL